MDDEADEEAGDDEREERDDAGGEEVVVGEAVEVAEEIEGEHRIVDRCPAEAGGVEELVACDGFGVVDVPTFVVVDFEVEEGAGEGDDGCVDGDGGTDTESVALEEGEKLMDGWGHRPYAVRVRGCAERYEANRETRAPGEGRESCAEEAMGCAKYTSAAEAAVRVWRVWHG
jgi:hypothetical protein